MPSKISHIEDSFDMENLKGFSIQRVNGEYVMDISRKQTQAKSVVPPKEKNCVSPVSKQLKVQNYYKCY